MFVLPDAELEVIGALRGQLVGAGVGDVYLGNRVPESRRPRMVVVRRDGGRSPDVARDLARLSVQVWADGEQEAADLAAYVRAGFRQVVGVGSIRNVVEVSGPTRIPDESKQALIYLVYEVTLRGSDT